jgi:DNA repair photolyase
MTITDLIEFEDASQWDGPYKIVEAKRALSPSGLPGIEYALNPYGGCEHGCVYCYAPEVLHTDWKDWRVVKVRSNIPDRLSKELVGLEGTIGIGTVTDPYQYAEKRFMLTLKCLEILKKKNFRIHLHTKSDLILRDIDLISSMKGEVGITITTVVEKYSKITEPGAPLPQKRLEALKRLCEKGVDAYALIGPVLNHLEGSEAQFVEAVASTGVKRVYIDSLNSRPLLTMRLSRMNMHGSDRSKEKIRDLATSAGLIVRDVF